MPTLPALTSPAHTDAPARRPGRPADTVATSGRNRRKSVRGTRPGARAGRRQQRRDRRRRGSRPGCCWSAPPASTVDRTADGRGPADRRGRAAVGRRGRASPSPKGSSGIECLSGIPGSAGATPIQNVGAYGQEVAETITAVRAYDRARTRCATLAPAECGFAYRTSIFKHNDRMSCSRSTSGCAASPLSAPVRYAELARTLGVAVGDRAPLADARGGGAGAAGGQGHGARPGRPGHLLGRLVLHQPGARPGRVRRPAGAAPATSARAAGLAGRRTARSRSARPG